MNNKNKKTKKKCAKVAWYIFVFHAQRQKRDKREFETWSISREEENKKILGWKTFQINRNDFDLSTGSRVFCLIEF